MSADIFEGAAVKVAREFHSYRVEGGRLSEQEAVALAQWLLACVNTEKLREAKASVVGKQ